MRKIGSYFYLVFGHNYDRIYANAHTGIYTEEIRKFRLELEGGAILITDYITYKDPSGNTGSLVPLSFIVQEPRGIIE